MPVCPGSLAAWHASRAKPQAARTWGEPAMSRLATILCCAVVLSCAAFLIPATRAGEVLGKKATEWIKILVNDDKPKARRVALTALTILGPKADRVMSALIYALKNDPDTELRREVAQILGRFGEDARLSIRALANVLS